MGVTINQAMDSSSLSDTSSMNSSSIAEHSTQNQSFQSDIQGGYSSTLNQHSLDKPSLFEPHEQSSQDKANDSFMSVSDDPWQWIVQNPMVVGACLALSLVLLSACIGMFKSRRMSIEALAESPEIAKLFWESTKGSTANLPFKDKDTFIKYCKDKKVTMPMKAEFQSLKDIITKMGFLVDPKAEIKDGDMKYTADEVQTRMHQAFELAFAAKAEPNGIQLAFTPEFFAAAKDISTRTEAKDKIETFIETWLKEVNDHTSNYVGTFVYYIIFGSFVKTPAKRSENFTSKFDETKKKVYGDGKPAAN